MYNENIIQRMSELKNAGGLRGCNAIGKAGTITSGDVMRIYLKVSEKGIIEDARFKTFGSVPAIIACDVLCDLIRGKSVDATTDEASILAVLGDIPKDKEYVATLALAAFADAVKKWRKSN